MPINKLISQLPGLGVGVTYCPELHEFIATENELINVVEVEPQTLWVRQDTNPATFLMPLNVKSLLDTLPQKKLIHSVGVPVGGHVRPAANQLALLRENIEYFNSPWASDHLSFNSTLDFHTGFFLPPRQTDRGVSLAVNNVRILQQELRVPIAVEPGVNYLKTRSDELEDGHFVCNVSLEADCAILLDLHNLYTNELNNRQSISLFLSQIPLDRVLEVHLAGGIEMDGYWLDAHSGAIPERLIKIAEEIIPHLPNLKAIIFEILPSYISVIGLKTIRKQLEIIGTLWACRKNSKEAVTKELSIKINTLTTSPSDDDSMNWEKTLGMLAIGLDKKETGTSFETLGEDNGVKILKKLIGEFRASMIVSILKLSSRYLMLFLGVDNFQLLLDDFWKTYSPQQFGSDESINFIRYLKAKEINLPILYQLLNFEEAVINTLIDGKIRTVEFTHDPMPLINALFNRKLPDQLREPGKFEIEITPDSELTFTEIKTLSQSRISFGH